MGSPRLPWKRIHEYLLALETAKSGEELLGVALANAYGLIPWDAGIYILDYHQIFLGGLGVTAEAADAYANHYRDIIPIWSEGRPGVAVPRVAGTNRVYWNDFADSEFVVDFARPMGWARCIGQLQPQPGQRTALCIQRGPFGRDFSETEILTMEHLSLHIDNFLSIFEKLSTLTSWPSAEALQEVFPRLSAREVEVARLFVLGLSAREIGSKLFISDRTVEAHLAHIYAKLGVRARAQLRDRLRRALSRREALP